ncbi:MAG: MATE family efflux transporter [Clostridia bacterium]|nr:MATE family efflux transporter [Clostridia bacterium]
MAIASKQTHKDLTEGNIFRQIILFALPLIATSVLQLLFNTADTIVVGRWGGDTEAEREIALAAVGSCGAIIHLVVNVFLGLSVGAGVCVAHGIGAKEFDDVEKTLHTAVFTALIGGVLVTAIGFIFAPQLLGLIGIESSILPEAILYMRAYFCGMPAALLYNYCAAMLRASGDTARPLGFLTIAGIANVLFNLMMVLVFKTGALGVGVATAISNWVSCALIVLFMLKTEGPCHLDVKKIAIHKEPLKKILKIGLPAGIQSSLFSISNVIIQSALQSFQSATVIAGHTAASNIQGYVYTVMNSTAQSSMNFTGQHVGAKKWKRLKTVVLCHYGLVFGFGISIGWTMYLFGRPLLNIFTPGNTGAIEVGMINLAIIGLTYFICGGLDVGSYTMRGFGKSLVPTLISLIGACALRIVWIYAVFYPFYPDNLTVLYLSYPITWIITAVAYVPFIIHEFKKHKNDEITETAQTP